jgi:putative ABC transport system ATP-binding protein
MNIEISELSFAYSNRTFRLDIPQLRIKSGTAVAFVGPSGSGKTTLLRLLAGIYRPDAGRILLDAVEISGLRDAERRRFRITGVGFVFQDFQLIDYLNVEENIRLPFRIHRAVEWSQEAAARLEELMQATGVADKRKRRINELSHGEKQRVAICRSLLTGPRLVLADEPTGNLDPVSKRRILDILFQETRKQGASLIMVTHDQQLLGDFDEVIDFQEFQCRT